MQSRKIVISMCLAAVVAAAQGASSTALPPDDRPSDLNAIHFGIRAEAALRTWMSTHSPVVEGYFQGFDSAPKIGFALTDDAYVLGRYNRGKMENLLGYPASNGEGSSEVVAAEQRLLDGLQQVMEPDSGPLSPELYDYEFAGQTVLGTVPCLMYDVKPRSPETAPFEGRIYLERRMWNLVRFSGYNSRVDQFLSALRNKQSRFRIDSWRNDIGENRWVPAFAYVEEAPPLGAPDTHIVKGQIRAWGYGKVTELTEQVQTEVKLWQSASTVAGSVQRGCSPQQCQRLFENQAEANVVARLFQARLLGVKGEIERKLDQIMTALLVSNQLTLPQTVRCRVLLTTRLEAFIVGNTLIMSRGLIDVLPETAIAMVMGHQLGHVLAGHLRIDTRCAFPEVLRISDAELLAKLRFHHTAEEEKEADERAMKILNKSPYARTLPEGQLAIQALQDYAPHLRHLIEPSFGEHVADANEVVRNDTGVREAPEHVRNDATQVAGLPLGSKLLVSPGNGRLELLRAEGIAMPALYERREFQVTAVQPFLDYFVEKEASPKLSTVPAAPQRATHGTSGPQKPTVTSVKKGG